MNKLRSTNCYQYNGYDHQLHFVINTVAMIINYIFSSLSCSSISRCATDLYPISRASSFQWIKTKITYSVQRYINYNKKKRSDNRI